MKILKKLSVFDIIIGILFIVITFLSIMLFKWLGLLAIPILILLIFIYYNSDKIAILIKNLIRNIRKKSNNEDNEDIKANYKNKNNNRNIDNKKKKKYSIDDCFEDNDIIIDKEKEILYEKKEKDIVKKVSKNNNKSKTKVKTKNVKNNKEKKKKKNILKVVLTVFLSFCIICVLAVAAFFAYIVITTDDFDPDKLTYRDQSVVYDKNGNVIAELGVGGSEKRESVSYDDLPQVLIDAIIATEDSRFFQHNGVDAPRFLKASVEQVLHIGSGGGASTLTMQVSKNNLTSTESKGLEGIIRKFRDVYISVFQIEKKYTKEQIIEFYVNDNLLGGSNYGVEQASQAYFGKSVSDLNLAEAATLAGIFQTPNKYRPDLHPEACEKRRNTVLSLMKRHGYITEEEEEATKAISVESLIVSKSQTETYQGYIETVIDELEEKLKVNPYEVSLKIYTALDTSIQNGIDKIMSGETYTWQNDVVQAGSAVIDVNTGEVVAIGAGRNRDGERTWNYATQARRHPGSTAKPLFDYGPGFEYSNYSTYTLFNDEPWTYTNGPSVNNWDGNFEGLMTLRTALSVSRNIPALKAFQQNNKSNIKDFVTKLGIKPEEPLHEAHSIGGFTGATPLEMAAAYAAFANGGYYIEPHTVNKVEYRSTGEVKELKYTKERVMEASTAYLINNVLKYAVDTYHDGGAYVAGKTVAAKTGTSSFDDATIQKYGLKGDPVNDLWTVAYTPQYSYSLWYGYKELSSEYYNTNSTGGSYKNSLMRAITKCIPMTSEEFAMPDTVVQSQVEFGTWPAQLPSEYTPSDLIRTEYFKKGTQPTEVSTRFQKFNDVTNIKTTKSGGSTKITWDYTTPEEFTESYLKKYFSQNVFGNGTNTFVSQRLNYAGGIGFGIYSEDTSGNLKLIGFTTDNEYNYSGTASSLVIKVQYKDYNANASDGAKIKLSNSSSIIDDNNKNFDVNISSSGSASIGNYSEKDIVVKYKNKDVTKDSVITYMISELNYRTNSKTEFVAKINEITETGTYNLRYQITYNGESYTRIKKLYLHANNETRN